MDKFSATARPATPEVARRLFERNRLRQPQAHKALGYDEWATIFRSQKTNRAIAKETGLSQERVRRLRLAYFPDTVTDETNGFALRRATTRQRYQDKARELPIDGAVRMIAQEAIACGLSVRQVSRVGSRGTVFRIRRILINDMLCEVAYLRHPRVPSKDCKRRYSMWRVTPDTLAEIAAKVVVQEWEEGGKLRRRFLVLSSELLTKLCAGRPRVFAIPVEFSDRDTIVDWQSHEGKKGWAFFRQSPQ